MEKQVEDIFCMPGRAAFGWKRLKKNLIDLLKTDEFGF